MAEPFMISDVKDPKTGISIRFVKQFDLATDKTLAYFDCWVPAAWFEAWKKVCEQQDND